METLAAIPAVETVTWVFIGIIISLILPIAVRTLQNAKVLEAIGTPKPSIGKRIGEAWRKYGGPKYTAIAIAATVVAIVLVFLLGLEFFTVRDAALAGFAWESLINKLLGSNEPSTGG